MMSLVQTVEQPVPVQSSSSGALIGRNLVFQCWFVALPTDLLERALASTREPWPDDAENPFALTRGALSPRAARLGLRLLFSFQKHALCCSVVCPA